MSLHGTEAVRPTDAYAGSARLGQQARAERGVEGRCGMDPKRKVEAGYDRMAERYLAARDTGPDAERLLDEWGRALPPHGTALDLGCGAGVPVARWLARRYAVTGVDLSGRQIELARQHVPEATFLKADMTDLEFPPGSFDVVTAFWSIIHVSRSEQPALLARVYGWLRPAGAFLATWALTGWEGEEQDWEGWGARMWWSHYGRQENLAMLGAAAFDIERAEPVAGGGETWLWVLARKPG